MNPIRPSALTLGLLVFVIMLASSSPMAAQTFYGLAGGMNYAGPAPSSVNPQGDAHYTRGFAIQASIGRQFGDRLAARLDAFVNHFAVQQPPQLVAAMCSYPGPCRPPQIDGYTLPVGIGALTASGIINVDPPGRGVRMYLIAGGGAYYLYRHPSAEGAVRFGVSAGAGFAVRANGLPQVFLEARYHDILGAPSQPTWLVPVTFGIRL